MGGIFMDKYAALQYLKFVNSFKGSKKEEKYYDFLFWLRSKKLKKRGKKKYE